MKCYFEYRLNDVLSKKRPRDSEGTGVRFYPENFNGTADCEISWFLLTSSNLSMAAWGKCARSGSQIYVKSYELGVLFLPERILSTRRTFSCTPAHNLLGTDDSNVSESIAAVVPIPFKFPAESYTTEDIPWSVNSIYLTVPDRFGRVCC
jgi:tyrosyl-DNA phosphodiesterase-1